MWRSVFSGLCGGSVAGRVVSRRMFESCAVFGFGSQARVLARFRCVFVLLWAGVGEVAEQCCCGCRR